MRFISFDGASPKVSCEIAHDKLVLFNLSHIQYRLNDRVTAEASLIRGDP